MFRVAVSCSMLVVLVFKPVLAAPLEGWLGVRLEDAAREAARSVEGSVLERTVSQSPEQITGDAEERIRAKLVALSLGTPVTFTLRDGEKVVGELAEVSDADFEVRVPAPDKMREDHGSEATWTTKYEFGEVWTLFAGSDPRDIPTNKRVEVRLVGGEKVTGRLHSIGDGELSVDSRRIVFDEIVSVHELGMRPPAHRPCSRWSSRARRR